MPQPVSRPHPPFAGRTTPAPRGWARRTPRPPPRTTIRIRTPPRGAAATCGAAALDWQNSDAPRLLRRCPLILVLRAAAPFRPAAATKGRQRPHDAWQVLAGAARHRIRRSRLFKRCGRRVREEASDGHHGPCGAPWPHDITARTVRHVTRCSGQVWGLEATAAGYGIAWPPVPAARGHVG